MQNVSENRKKALAAALNSLNKKFKNSPVTPIKEANSNIERFSTGFLSLDYVCGGREEPGLPKG